MAFEALCFFGRHTFANQKRNLGFVSPVLFSRSIRLPDVSCFCFFLVFSSGCIPWGRRLDTVKGEGGGWVKCFKAFHPSPPFKVYKGVPLFCGTLGI